MRIGMMLPTWPPDTIDEIVDQVGNLESEGFSTVWTASLSAEALTTIAVVGREVPRIELGTAVIPTYPRHPMVLAQQALTAQAACGGRLTLGIGPSHQILIEGIFGYSFDKPARHMKEYLSALLPLLREGTVAFSGETIKAQGQL